MTDFTHPLLPNGIPNDWVTGSGKQRVLNLPFVAGESLLEAIRNDAELGLFDWQLNCQVKKLKNSQPELPLTTGNVIVVSSGKGGVGKSSVSVNLALALSQLGAKVGLLDADIYGPSIPTMLGGGGAEMELTKNNKMLPLERHGLYVHSLGYLVDDNDATIWRGPMASGALQQLYKDTAWPALDYLIVDMPPGTGDIQLTMAQKLPVTGAVVVTTPQTVALKDAEKGVAMFEKLNIPLIGILENMSFYQCPSCGHEDPVFGKNGGADMATEHNLPLLGQWPLNSDLRESLDGDTPLLLAQPRHPLSQLILNSAQQVAANLYYQQENSL
ncbi:iron-sulfur cluster carrier protein ApbC [Idiomarina ramblicola]|uniref:Iron-sulfur cluster carrier protein n=1 Tax=Idiomarina ramblicola TaxID=263724 RepID=A0A432Z4S0_9GAMM|nr:iron-sulfur cluster carrier protein ApbC [Idiomarina ramblicola]RUO72894.1 iron-sulfur cluster carrier protein ApbC [Idiomarina ramblicola]